MVDDFEGRVNYLWKGDDEDTQPDIRYNDGILTEGRHEVWWTNKKERKAAQSQNSKRERLRIFWILVIKIL